MIVHFKEFAAYVVLVGDNNVLRVGVLLNRISFEARDATDAEDILVLRHVQRAFTEVVLFQFVPTNQHSRIVCASYAAGGTKSGLLLEDISFIAEGSHD